MYSQGFYFEPRAGGEVRIFGFYTNKKTKEKINATKMREIALWSSTNGAIAHFLSMEQHTPLDDV